MEDTKTAKLKIVAFRLSEARICKMQMMYTRPEAQLCQGLGLLKEWLLRISLKLATHLGNVRPRFKSVESATMADATTVLLHKRSYGKVCHSAEQRLLLLLC